MHRTVALSVLCAANVACLDVAVRPGVEVTCTTDESCLDGTVCSPLTDRCVAPGDIVAPHLGLRVDVGVDRVTLAWTPPSATQVTEVLVERDGNLEIARVSPELSGAVDESVELDTRYRYSLRLVVDGEVFSPHEDDVVEVISAPRPVTGLRAEAVGAETVLTWEHDNSEENALGFRVTRDGEPVAVLDGDDELRVVETLAPDSLVTYAVAVRGLHSDSVLATATGRSLPLAPAPVAASTVGADELSVTWTDTSAHEHGVIVERLADDTVEATFELPADETGLSDTGLRAGVTYTYRVRLTGPAGESATAEGSERTSRDPEPSLSAPTLDETCTLSLVGDPGVDGEKAATAVGTSVVMDTEDVPTSTAAGISMPVTDFDRPGWNIDWTITDDLGGEATLSVFQPLSSVDLTQPSDLLPMLTAAERSLGHQVWDVAAEQAVTFAPGACGSCAGETSLVSAGRLRCFTSGADRQLYCMGRLPAFSTRVRLPESVGLAEVSDVASSNDHACAIVGSNGAVYCWGQSSSGRLGDGSLVTSAVSTPVQVCRAGTQVGDPDGPACEPLVGAVDLTTGKFGNPQPASTCALLEDSTAVCWGKEQAGQFGNGAGGPADNVYRKPTPICADDLAPCTPLDRIAALEVGANGGCAIRDDGEVLCWGTAELIRTTVAEGLPTASMPALTGAVRVSLGGVSGCAVMPDTSVLCFGRPRQGVSGDGDLADDAQDPLPVCASGAHINGTCVPLTGAVDVSVQGTTACALMQDRTVMCWGQNASGALGVGLTPSELPNTGNPMQVCSPEGCGAPLDDIVALDVGVSVVCAVDRFKKAWCWGGEPLGNNEQNQNYASPLPIQVCNSADCVALFEANTRSCFEFDVVAP